MGETVMDSVTYFIDEMCVIDEKAECSKAQLWSWYARWAELQGIRPVSQVRFGKLLKKHFPQVQMFLCKNVEQDWSDGIMMFKGLKLNVVSMTELADTLPDSWESLKLSFREQEFNVFAAVVSDHIANYTIPQYGDAPTDELETWTAAQCVKAISKYTARFESGRRGQLETLRDLVKIAHFAAVAFSKLLASGDDIRKIRAGKV